MKNITGVILAGGKSSRMGTDKGVLMIRGKKMIEHIIDALKPCVDEIIIIANNDHYNYLGYKVFSDLITDCGPLGGVFTAMENSLTDKNFIVSCDVPNLNTEVIEYIISKYDNDDVVMPISNGQIEPLCALYSKLKKDQIKAFLEKGIYKIKDVVKFFNTRYIEVSLDSEMFKGVFDNVNTPKDFIEQNQHEN